MSWWSAWKQALSHPADNVVAAVVVLIGVAVTATVTLIVSAANRRHEKATKARERRAQTEREALERIFQPRAEAYLIARSDLRDRMISALIQPKRNRVERRFLPSPEFKDYTARLYVYGEPEVVAAFDKARGSISKFAECKKAGETKGVLDQAEKAMRAAVAGFDSAARTSIQHLRELRVHQV